MLRLAKSYKQFIRNAIVCGIIYNFVMTNDSNVEHHVASRVRMTTASKCRSPGLYS